MIILVSDWAKKKGVNAGLVVYLFKALIKHHNYSVINADSEMELADLEKIDLAVEMCKKKGIWIENYINPPSRMRSMLIDKPPIDAALMIELEKTLSIPRQSAPATTFHKNKKIYVTDTNILMHSLEVLDFVKQKTDITTVLNNFQRMG